MAAIIKPPVDLTYTLDDRYTRQEGRIYLSGIQALVRLPIMQALRDKAAGLNTGGFVSGYRGSPLGGLDQALWSAKKHLKAYQIEFTPGLNEDLAATMVWGSQQANLFPHAKHDGVFAMWYGKGPGVDRSGDVFKHGNAAGTSRHGGVLALAGDDHASRSSTLPHGSELEFVSAMMPVLNPAGVQDILDMGILGWAMSRFTGRWVGFKTIAETVESSASVSVDPHQLKIVLPEEFMLPPGGLNIRWPDPPLDQEMRLHQFAMHAAVAFARANHLDRVVIDSPKARLGIVTTGKSYLDVLQALEDLGLTRRDCEEIGIRVYKVGMTWPLEPEGIRAFARGLEDIIVVEEKRSFIESQMKEAMYNWDQGIRPSVVGKYDEAGNWILPSTFELTPAMIALVIAKRLSRFFTSDAIKDRLAFIHAKEAELALPRANFPRAAHYCSGCPHNTSTVVPEGSRALGGIGCHYMVTWMDRRTDTFTQMGGEGATWCGQAPFTNEKHVFQNLGDGTYFHSGSLAIRQAIAAKVNITYKILYNDAVAMTGGQPLDGTLTVPDLAHQVRAEGVKTIIVMSDDIEKWSRHEIFPDGVEFLHRDELEATQRRLRDVEGVSVLIYDQTCAAEKRRRRKRKLMVDPAKRIFINSLVCEGCGDCGVKSNCVSLLPLETEFGRKRSIDQSSCNKDFSCVKGFCPSFVTIKGGGLKKSKGVSAEVDFSVLPAPTLPTLAEPFNIIVTGIGGTGVVTIGALLGMAAHLENKGATVLDQTGLAQKGGAVTTHVRIAREPKDIHAVRIAAGEADLVLGADMVVVNDYWTLSKIREGRAKVVLNTYEAMPGSFTRKPDMQFPAAQIVDAVRHASGGVAPELIDATAIATTLLGDSIATNLFMLGYAWQKGLVPVSLDALSRAIELNAAAIDMNKRAFSWGRYAAHDLAFVRRAAGLDDNTAASIDARAASSLPGFAGQAPGMGGLASAASLPINDQHLSTTLDEMLARRRVFLTDYQNADYAQRYLNLVARVRSAEQSKTPGATTLTEAVARYAFKLMAYKDEYEVARLYSQPEFWAQIGKTFDGEFKVHFNLAPPLFSNKDADGNLLKSEYGPWIRHAFKLLKNFKFLRGTALDPFGRTDERRMERQLIVDYTVTVEELIGGLNRDNHRLAVQLAQIPEHIRGFGHVKEQHLKAAREQWNMLLAQWRNPPAAQAAA